MNKTIIVSNKKIISFTPPYEFKNAYLLKQFLLETVNQHVAEFEKVQDDYFGDWEVRNTIELRQNISFKKKNTEEDQNEDNIGV